MSCSTQRESRNPGVSRIVIYCFGHSIEFIARVFDSELYPISNPASGFGGISSVTFVLIYSS